MIRTAYSDITISRGTGLRSKRFANALLTSECRAKRDQERWGRRPMREETSACLRHPLIQILRTFDTSLNGQSKSFRSELSKRNVHVRKKNPSSAQIRAKVSIQKIRRRRQALVSCVSRQALFQFCTRLILEIRPRTPIHRTDSLHCRILARTNCHRAKRDRVLFLV